MSKDMLAPLPELFVSNIREALEGHYARDPGKSLYPYVVHDLRILASAAHYRRLRKWMAYENEQHKFSPANVFVHGANPRVVPVTVYYDKLLEIEDNSLGLQETQAFKEEVEENARKRRIKEMGEDYRNII